MPDDSRDDHCDLLRHQRRLAASARRLGDDAEDLASDAVLRALARPAPDGRQEAWLERIFHNVVIDHHRRRARQTRALSALGAEASVASPPPEDPESALLAAERRRSLAGAWPRLVPAARQVLDHRFGQERDDAEVARALGISSTTVRTRVHRALLELRRMLGQLRGVFPLWCFGPQPAALALLPLALSAALATGGLVAFQAGEGAPRSRPAVTKARDERAAPPAPEAAPAAKPPAARQPTSPRPPRSATTTTAAVQRFEYGDDEITGDRQGPDDLLLVGPPGRARSASLIEIPSSFMAAAARSIEEL